MLTLLNNWNGELDRARAWAKEPQKGLLKRLRDATASISRMEGEIDALGDLPVLNDFCRERKSNNIEQIKELRELKKGLARRLETLEA